METGNHYNYFRDYDASIGRYIQSDPIGLLAGLNTYGYVAAKPLVAVDPLGLAPGGGGSIRPDPTPPNLQPCGYYDNLCKQTSCRYYCDAAPRICRNAENLGVFRGIGTSKLNCIRTCLVGEDQAARGGGGGGGGGGSGGPGGGGSCVRCLPDQTIDDYHRKCFTMCGVSPDRYPGVNPWWLPFNPNKQ